MVSSAPLAGINLQVPTSAPAPVVTMPAPTSDKITWLLLAATIFFALILIGIDKLFPNEGQVFQVIANLTSGFAGAFFTRIQPVGQHPGTPAPVIPISNSFSNIPAPPPDQAAAALAAATAAAPPPTPVKSPGVQP